MHYLDARDLKQIGGAYSRISQDNVELHILKVLPDQEDNIEARDTWRRDDHYEAMKTLCYL